MNIPMLLYLLLFIPFIILFAIFGSTFMTAGYKKDLGRSLISFGATLGAIIVSLILSKLTAWGLSFIVTKPLTKTIPNDNGMMSGFIGGAAQGVIKITLALILFGIFFAISMSVFKSVIVPRINIDKLNFDTNGSKWGGLGVRFVDALLVVIMLSLPLYGTLAMVIPPVSTIIQLSEPQQDSDSAIVPTKSTKNNMGIANMDTTEDFEDEFEDYITDGAIAPKPTNGEQTLVTTFKKLESHPVLALYKYGPADWVYSGLSSFSMNGKSVDVARAAEIMAGLADRFSAFIEVMDSNDEEQVRKAVERVVSYTRKNVIEERWFYNMAMALLGEFDKEIAKHSDEIGEGMTVINQLRPLLDMSYKEFKSNGIAVLDFMEYCLSPEIMNLLGKRGFGLSMSDEFLTKLGDVINHSEQAVAAKRLIYTSCIMSDFDEQDLSPLFANWGTGMLTEAEDKKRDAATFFAITAGIDEFDLLQLIAINPLFGGKNAASLLTSRGIIDEIYGEFYDYTDEDTISALLQNDTALISDFEQILISYKDLSALESCYFSHANSFEDYVLKAVADKLGIDYEVDSYSNAYNFSIETDENGQNWLVNEDGNRYPVANGNSLLVSSVF